MRYLGNKTRIAKHLIPFLAEHKTDRNMYIEPFVGAAGMMSQVPFINCLGYDNDRYIVALLNAIRHRWQPPMTVSEDVYLAAREDYKCDGGAFTDEMIAFVGYGCSFDGKWFGGYARGGGRNHAAESARNLLKLAPQIRYKQFLCADYKDINVYSGNVVYCDPPYGTGTQYKNTFNTTEFFEWVRTISDKNYVYVSEYNAPEDFEEIFQLPHKTGLNKNKKPHKETTEKLFVWKHRLKH
jgi:DNA adenine methylase